MEKTQSSPKKFKFCYVMQGLPGSGKTTVAKELAGVNGKIFTLDQQIVERNKKLVQDQHSLEVVYDEIFQQFCDEIAKGTDKIIIDNTNLSEWEYIRFVKKAQQEHYFVSIVVLPPPDEIQTAMERSQFDVNDDEMTQMLAKWEPFSPSLLLDKSHQLRSEGLQQQCVPSFHRLSANDMNSQKQKSLINMPSAIAESQQEEDEANQDSL